MNNPATPLVVDTSVTNRGHSPPTLPNTGTSNSRAGTPDDGSELKNITEGSQPDLGGNQTGSPPSISQSGAGVVWSVEEQSRLLAAVDRHRSKNWKKICQEVGTDKTEEDCQIHWREVLLRKGTIVKGKGSWTKEEDAALKALVKKHGKTKWSFIGKFLPGRVGKQCRERWHNHLNPDLNKRAWTEDEEKLIVAQRAKLGNRWAKIARMLPGRSDNDVKNRWYASLRKRVDEDIDPSVLLPKKRRGGKKAAERAAKKAVKKASGSKRKSPGGAQQRAKKRKTNTSRNRADSGLETPLVSPQKNMLIAAAYLSKFAQSPRAPTSPAAVSAAITNAANKMSARGKAAISRLSIQSGAKMLRDAEFLISLGGPPSMGSRGQLGLNPMMAYSPSGVRQLMPRDSFGSESSTASPHKRPGFGVNCA